MECKMKRVTILSATLFLLLLLSCGESAVSMMDPDGANTLSTSDGNPKDAEVCHDNMGNLSTAIHMFFGMNNRYPDSIGELEMIDPKLCSLKCPSCSMLYLYDLSSSGEVWTVTCPLPVKPNHSNVVNGVSSWPPDPSEWSSICHSNMRSLASACAMFYGSENRYPDELRELGTSGIYENWDRPCPGCGELYFYDTNSIGDTYSIHCPMPVDPNHGYVIDGICYWPQDTTGSQNTCRHNMMGLASGFAMFYGSYNRYPEELSELGTSGIMGNWDVPCPACGEIYHYSTDPNGQTYLIQCPLPWDPGHGSIVDGIISWD